MGKNNAASLKYTRTHEWLSVQGNLVTCGITHHAQEILGDVVFVEFPAPGSRVKAGDKLVGLESDKAVSDIYSPFGGEITEVNEAVTKTPGLVNKEPLGSGWLFKIRCDEEPALSEFLDEQSYQKFIRDA